MRLARLANAAVASSSKRNLPARVCFGAQRQWLTSTATNLTSAGDDDPKKRTFKSFRSSVIFKLHFEKTDESVESSSGRLHASPSDKQLVKQDTNPDKNDNTVESSLGRLDVSTSDEQLIVRDTDFAKNGLANQARYEKKLDKQRMRGQRSCDRVLRRQMRRNGMTGSQNLLMRRTFEEVQQTGFKTASMLSQPESKAMLYEHWVKNICIMRARNAGAIAGDIVVPTQTRKDFTRFIRQLQAQDYDTRQDDVSRIRNALSKTALIQSQRWKRFDFAGWPSFMLLIMRYQPESACAFIRATFNSQLIPSSMLVDVMVGLGHQHPNDVLQVLLESLPLYPHDPPKLHNTTLNELLNQAETEVVIDLFDYFSQHKHLLVWRTCNKFASILGRSGEYERGINALELSLELGGEPAKPFFFTAASAILRRSILHPNGYHDSNFIVQKFSEMGMDINVHFQTSLIANAFDSNDHATALKFFFFMNTTGIEPNHVTFGAMLKGIRDQGDDATMKGILALSFAKLEETKETWLANELLYYHHYQNMKRVPERKRGNDDVHANAHLDGLQNLVALYASIFDTAPLRLLGLGDLVPPEYWVPPSTLSLRPTSFTMSLMLMAFFRARVALRSDPGIGNYVLRVYRKWWDIVTKPTPDLEPWMKTLFLDMATTPAFSNACMHALTFDETTVPHVIKIMERMSSGIISIITDDGMPQSLGTRAPDIFTWNIMLNSFATYGQYEGVVKCLSIMPTKGIVPNAISWNLLIKAHAKAQNVPGVVDALHQKEAAGFGVDRGLTSHLAMVKDRRALSAVLKRYTKLQDVVMNDEFSDAKLLGREESNRQPWMPDQDAVVGYTLQENQARRRVMYFDANRTQGLRDSGEEANLADSVDWFEPDEEVPSRVVRIAKSDDDVVMQTYSPVEPDDEEGWFEPDEEVAGKTVNEAQRPHAVTTQVVTPLEPDYEADCVGSEQDLINVAADGNDVYGDDKFHGLPTDNSHVQSSRNDRDRKG